MSTITTRDGVDIFYKDWGPKNSQPIVFHHGWPLSSDDWDTQMLFFVHRGTFVGIDRRGHGRSSQVSDGHDMDHYAADAAAVVEHLSFATLFISATPPVAAKPLVTSRVTARVGSPSWCLPPPSRQLWSSP